MNTLPALEQQAINAAKNHDWHSAIAINTQITEEYPEDVNTHIRLGVALVQVGEIKKAKAAFEAALELDKPNQLAKKHLQKLNNHQPITLSALPADEQFIEEPGKTKTVELHRLASKEQLEQLSVGQTCALKPKNRFISVEVEPKTYVGSLPEDLSARLTKLIDAGNGYTCYIRSVSPTSCSVFLKEAQRSAKNKYVNSFPPSKNQMATINDMFLVDENIPLMEDEDYVPPQIVYTDKEDEDQGMVDKLPIEEHHHEDIAPIDDMDE